MYFLPTLTTQDFSYTELLRWLFPSLFPSHVVSPFCDSNEPFPPITSIQLTLITSVVDPSSVSLLPLTQLLRVLPEQTVICVCQQT